MILYRSIKHLTWCLHSVKLSMIFVSLVPVCPIKEQIRKECALHPNCTRTCSNVNKSVDCPDVCIFNGCECPNGTVADKKNMECIPQSECPGMSVL